MQVMSRTRQPKKRVKWQMIFYQDIIINKRIWKNPKEAAFSLKKTEPEGVF